MSPSVVPISDLPRLQAWKDRGGMTKVEDVEVFSIASPNFGPSSSSTSTGNRKPGLILVHGYPTASHDYWKIYDQLEEKFDLFCWDFVGYGFSQKVHRTISQQIDILEALLLQKGYTSSASKDGNQQLEVHILSHDLGDTLVQEMLARTGSSSPDSTGSGSSEQDKKLSFTILSVVMLNGGILPKMHRPTLIQKALLVPGLNSIAASLSGNMFLFQYGISKVFGPNTKPTPEELQEYHALVTCNGGDALITENIKYMTERQTFHDRWVDSLKAYAKSKPFCLIDGPADPVSGRHLAEAVEDQVDGAKVVYLSDDIGHWPQVEAPEETMKAFLEFHDEINTFGAAS